MQELIKWVVWCDRGWLQLQSRRVRGPRRLVLGQLEQRWQCGSRVP
nr:MAG TPA: hypothetical protein [Caudoviricetes sp.]DAX82762.1 MAG TPA: hypothetical protein [Caudoviricetes sp.]